MTTRRSLLRRGYGWRGCKCWYCTPKRRPQIDARADLKERLEEASRPRVVRLERLAKGVR